MEWKSQHHGCLFINNVIILTFQNNGKHVYVFSSNAREQQLKSEPCSELELLAIRACAATLCCGTIKDEWFQKTVAPWLDQLMIAHEVNSHLNFISKHFSK